MVRELSWRYFDFWLLGAVVLATAFGIAMIRSAVAGNEQLLPLINRQIYFALAGLIIIFLLAAVDYRYWLALYRPIYFVMIVLLFALFLSAQAVFGAERWFRVGVLFVQPTEFAKIVVILILARYFQNSQNQPRDLRWILRAFLWVFGLTIWILLQPNLSNVIVIMVIFMAMLWVNGLQQKRVINFLFPDPTARHGAVYNVQQALIAIGSGGLFGKGYGHGTQTQLRFLKVRHTDFIFSATAEEFGIIGAIMIILIEAFIIWRCIRAAQKARDLSGAMIALGVTLLLFFQAAARS